MLVISIPSNSSTGLVFKDESDNHMYLIRIDDNKRVKFISSGRGVYPKLDITTDGSYTTNHIHSPDLKYEVKIHVKDQVRYGRPRHCLSIEADKNVSIDRCNLL